MKHVVVKRPRQKAALYTHDKKSFSHRLVVVLADLFGDEARLVLVVDRKTRIQVDLVNKV